MSRQNIDKWADRLHWSERVKAALVADTERAARADEQAKLNVAEERERERLKFQQRALEASKRATERGLQILKQSAKGSKPSDAARLLAVGDMIGRSALEVPCGTGGFGLHPVSAPVVHVTFHLDEISTEVARMQKEFFRANPDIAKWKNWLTNGNRRLNRGQSLS